MTASRRQGEVRCPRCRSGETIPIVYGLPGTGGLFEKAQRREIELGGCCIVFGVSPRRRCTRCEFGFDPVELPSTPLR